MKKPQLRQCILGRRGKRLYSYNHVDHISSTCFHHILCVSLLIIIYPFDVGSEPVKHLHKDHVLLEEGSFSLYLYLLFLFVFSLIIVVGVE